GSEARGRWRLRVESAPGADPGTLDCWSLELDRDVTETTTASSGEVHATLSYKEENGLFRDARLQIARGGQRRLDLPVRRLTGARLVRLQARDLDGDREPEVLVELYTNGAHCCTITLIYRWDPRTNRYVSATRNWGDPGYRLADLDGDGRPELVSAD